MKRYRSHWQRELLAGLWLGGGVALLLTAFTFLIRGLLWLKGLHEPPGEFQQTRATCELVVACVAAFVSGQRVVHARHPALSLPYTWWLRTTPWHAGRPLPLGEPTLQPRSFLAAAILGAYLQWHGPWTWAVVPLEALFLGYACGALRPLIRAKCPERLPLAWIGGGLVLMLPPHPLSLLPLALAAYVVADRGVRRSLRSFPWFDEGNEATQRPVLPARMTRRSASLVVSPAAVADPRPDRARFYLARTALTGWWIFCLASQWHWNTPAKSRDFQESMTMLTGYFAGLVALVRWGVYRGAVLPPIGFFARLRSGRWIVPGYDRMLVAPLVLAALGVGATMIVARLPRGDVPAASGLIVFTLLSLAFLLPPSQYVWQLTGRFHFQAGHRAGPIRTAGSAQAAASASA